MRFSRKLLLLAVTGIFLMSSQPSATEPSVRIDSEYDAGHPIITNLCDKSRISISGAASVYEEAGLLTDGNRTTGIDASTIDEMEIQLYGSPPWANVITVIHSGELNVDISVKDVFKNPKTVEFRSSTIPAVEGGFETTLRFDDMRITAITLNYQDVSSEPESGEETIIFEVEAYYESFDSDDGLKSSAPGEVGVEYVQYYKNKPCNSGNIPDTKNDAKSFRDKLHDHLGWARQYTWGNADAWEKDFTSDNVNWADNVDFAFFSGHGNDGYVKFSHKKNDCYVENIECQGAWGNQDMEWIYFSSCQTLRLTNYYNVWNVWYGCFNGLHQILGWHSNMKDVNLGKYFGKYAAKKKYRILTSFKKAARKTHGAGWGSKTRKIVLLAETEDNANDHLHGAGYVSPDYSNNGWYYYYTHQFSGTKAANDKYENNIIEIDRANPSIITVKEETEPTIIVHNELLTQQVDSMPIFTISPRLVNQQYVENIANEFCSNYGFFCTYQLLFDSVDQEFSVIDGPHEMDVSMKTGAWEYTNTVLDGAPTTSPQFLPSPSITPALADGFWNTVGRLPLDAQSTGEPAFFSKALVNATTSEEDPDSSWNLSISASHERWIGSYPVIGPGASLDVVFGDNSELHTAYFGGWRDVFQSGQIQTVTLEDALQSVLVSGPEVAIGSLPLCDTFLVESAMLGYYEPNGDTNITELQPIWAVDGWCITDDEFGPDTSFYQLWIPADYLAPHGMINTPSQDTIVDPGTTVILAGIATSGTPPYTYNWYSDIDDFLGSGPSIGVATLSDTGKSGLPPAMHTVILEVVDANGAKDYASVGVQVGTSCCVNRGNVDGIIGVGGPIDVADLSYLVDYLFKGGAQPPCVEEGNVDGIVGAGGPIDVADLSYLVDFLFKAGPPSPACQ